MTLVESPPSLATRLAAHFGALAQDNTDVTWVRFPGSSRPITVEVVPGRDGGLVRISSEIGKLIDWRPGLSDAFLRRNANLGLAAFCRRDDLLIISARLPESSEDSALAAAVHEVAEIAAATIDQMRQIGALESMHDL